MSGNTQPVATDVNSIPSPQYYNTITGVYEYLNGYNGQLYSIPAIITPYTTTAAGGYEQRNVVKATPGTFFGVSGTMQQNAGPRWVMIFNTTTIPSANAIPYVQVSVVQTVSGQGDTNFSYQPAHPYVCSTGIYVASSSTGGFYTASGTADCFYMVDYL